MKRKGNLHPFQKLAFGRICNPALVPSSLMAIDMSMEILRKLSLKIAVLSLVTLSLMASAYAHRAADSADSTVPSAISASELEAYRLPDGSLPSFCITGERVPHETMEHCGFCTLGHGIGLPNPIVDLENGSLFVDQRIETIADAISRKVFKFGAHSRAPPFAIGMMNPIF